MQQPWVNIHTHTEYSLMDGVATAQEYARRAKAIGMPAIAITDHATLSGFREFRRELLAEGIKPMYGMEGYIAEDRFDKRDKASRTEPLDLIYNHIVLLAKNDVGMVNLNRLNELAWTEGFYRKPRIDFDILEQHKEGLIVSSACPSGILSKAIEYDELGVAKAKLRWFIDTFGEDFYVEVMAHTDARINLALLELAGNFGAKAITSCDCHHATLDQRVIQEIMLLLNTHAKDTGLRYDDIAKVKDPMAQLDLLYGDDRPLTFRHLEIHLASRQEQMDALAKQGIDAKPLLDNTLELAEKIDDIEFAKDIDLLPTEYKDPQSRLETIVLRGLKERGLDKPEYIERAKEELDVIGAKNFSPYFLIVRNMINWAKNHDIFVGPGRGSAAGSLICYALGITNVDPIKNNLLFFRFINPERNDFPDIDSDFMDSRRDEIKRYLRRQYKNVASIATYQRFKDKGVVRDVSRVFRVPLADVDKIMRQTKDWEDFMNSDEAAWFRIKYPQVPRYGEQLRGRIRGTGIHASGMVVSKEPVSMFAPVETRSVPKQDDRLSVIALDMNEAADIGFIKLDVLGLKTLTVIYDCLAAIEQRKGRKIVLDDLPLDDPNIYNMLSAGETKGVFQCEAAPYTSLIIKMGLRNFDELVASNALVRPGAMNTIGKDYLLRKQGKQPIRHVHESFRPYTEETYGMVLYQEQVMLACVTLGGMTMAEADKVRKIIGKKKDPKEFDAFKDKFVSGASALIGTAAAESLWHDFEAHAGYSFNKSHAVAYSMISYWTAWLKYYYPLEFMFSLLSNEADQDTRTEYLIEAKRMGIPLKLPHVNESQVDFSIEGDGIRFGLSSIKYISDKIASRYVAQRPFHSYADLNDFTFTKGSGVNSRALAAMDAIGAAAFEDNPRDPDKVRSNIYEYLNLPEIATTMPAYYHAYIDTVDNYDRDKVQLFLGIVKSIKRGNGWTRIELMDKTGSVGIFDKPSSTLESGRSYLILAAGNSIAEAIPAEDIANSDNPLIKYLSYKQLPCAHDEAYVLSFKPRTTKAGKRMANMVIATADRELYSVLVFPQIFSVGYMKCEPGTVVKMQLAETKEGSLHLKGVF